MNLEDIITNLVLNGGEGKSKSMQAINVAQKGDFEKADQLMKEADEFISKAHNFQTDLLQKEAAGELNLQFSLLVIHGQDHLMNAITVRDLAKEMINLYREIQEIKK